MNKTDNQEKFFMVWKPGTVPQFTHKNREAAETEANRLAEKQPCDKFLVLECVSRFRKLPDIKCPKWAAPSSAYLTVGLGGAGYRVVCPGNAGFECQHGPTLNSQLEAITAWNAGHA